MMQLQPQEKILFVSRRHWWIFFVAGIKAAFTVLVVVGGIVMAERFVPEAERVFTAEFLILTGAVIIEMLWIGFFLTVADFYLDAWVVTNERIMFVEIRGLFSRTANSVDYRSIQDVTVTVNGIIATFLDFGDIIIQSAGTHGNFRFRGVPKPAEVKERILAIKNAYLRSFSGQGSE